MSNNELRNKIEAVKKALKAIHQGVGIEDLKRNYGEILGQVSPIEIPLIEQELVKEGISVDEILKLCDLHVALFRDYLQPRELNEVPVGHPLYLFMRENEYILKQSEVLSLYASSLLKARESNEVAKYLSNIESVLQELRKIRLHYRKLQMAVFPYLEKRGIVAVPRVLWAREDQVILKIRELSNLLGKVCEDLSNELLTRELANKAVELAREVSEVVFRENKILYPALWALLTEGEWAAIYEIASDLGWLVSTEGKWVAKDKPVMPYELIPIMTNEQLEKLPKEFKDVISRGIQLDTYQIRGGGDLDVGTGFLSVEEFKALFRSLPVEVTYANLDDRVKFYSVSFLHKGFARTKTIIGRRLEYCHPPRLEAMVKNIAKEVKESRAPYREFWTRMGDRIIRVLIVPVKDDKGNVLGVAEVVEDLTNVVNNPEEIKRKVMVL